MLMTSWFRAAYFYFTRRLSEERTAFNSKLFLNCHLSGKRTKKALEALKCAKALDVVKDGRHLGKLN